MSLPEARGRQGRKARLGWRAARRDSSRRRPYNPGVRNTWRRVGLVGAALGALLLCGCPPRENDGVAGGGAAGGSGLPGGAGKQARPGTAPAQLSLALSGNFIGFTRPCGCTSDQSGGLPRLASVLGYLRQRAEAKGPVEPPAGAVCEPPPGLDPAAPVVLVECGNFADSQSRAPGPRARAHLEALAQMGCAAAVIGGQELLLSGKDAGAAFMNAPVTLCSANLKVAATDINIVPSVELAPLWHLVGLTIPAATGSAEAGPDAAPWAEATDAVEGARVAIAALPAGSRVFIACASLPPGLSEQLAALKVEGRSIIGLTGLAGTSAAGMAPRLGLPPRRSEKLLIASFYPAAPVGGAHGWEVRLDTSWPDEPEVLARVKAGENAQYEAVRADPDAWRKVDWGRATGMTAQEAALLTASPPEPPLELRYSGADQCLACHAEAAEIWDGSRHRHSYPTLVEHNEAQTFDCLECHTTGFLRPGGYDPAKSYDVLKDPRAAVGCESCHGPGALHVKLAQDKKWQAASAPRGRFGLARSTLGDCLRCHDSYNSPHFEPQQYWQSIAH